MKYIITEGQFDKIVFRYLNNQDFIQIEKKNRIIKITRESFLNTSNNEKAQDILLSITTPIMCIKNLKKLGLKNGEVYSIQAIGETIKVYNQEFKIKDFLETFVVCFAFTNHKVQGITIKEPYNIYEWNNMDIRAKYTAYSRTSDRNNIRLINTL
jgi:hypothetical protein